MAPHLPDAPGTPDDAALADYIRFLDGARRLPDVRRQKERILDLLAPRADDVALDAGCGTGDDARMLAAICRNGRVVGVDRRPGLVAEAERRAAGSGLRVTFQVGDIHRLEFPDGAFSVVRAERLFEHLDDPEGAIAELVRVTRPGGRVLVASPDLDSNLFDHPDRSVTRRIVHHACDARPNGQAGRQLFRLMRAAGLADVAVEALTHVSTSLAAAHESIPFAAWARDAAAAGVITAAEAAAWLAQLEATAVDGQWLHAITYFIAVGRRG